MANEKRETSTAPVKRETGKPSLGKRISRWFRDMRTELKKVVWPTPQQTAKNTGVALLVMAVAAVVIWGFDTLAGTGVKLLIQLAG